MTPITFCYTIPLYPSDNVQRNSYVGDLKSALNLIDGHFDSMRIIDHLDVGVTESFTTIAYLAALYPRLKFGHTVICQSFRNPALVAKMGASLQLLSGGRFLLGIGTGWNEAEYRAYGYDFPPAGVRVEQLEEAVQIIRAMWTGERVTFTGKHYRVAEVLCDPIPSPLPPIMIGAFKPKTFAITAKYADEWNVSSTGIQRYRHLVENFESACETAGRDPNSVPRSWGGGCICRTNPAEAKQIAGERYNSDPDDDFDFVGTPQQLIEQMGAFVDLGVSSFIVDCGGFPDLTTLELLIDEVIPALNQSLQRDASQSAS